METKWKDLASAGYSSHQATLSVFNAKGLCTSHCPRFSVSQMFHAGHGGRAGALVFLKDGLLNWCLWVPPIPCQAPSGTSSLPLVLMEPG